MGEIINLRRARKEADRRRRRQQAAANRLEHGRPKSARNLAAARDAKARRDLDQHRIDTGDER